MNSAGRRKCRRAWLRKNREEIVRVVQWINTPVCFVPSHIYGERYVDIAIKEIVVTE